MDPDRDHDTYLGEMTTVTRRALPAAAAVLCTLGMLGLAGCSARTRRPGQASQSLPAASCVPEPLARAPLPQEVGVYRAGPLTLVNGDDLAQHPEEWAGRRTSGSKAIVVLTGSRPAVLSVDRGSRGRFSLQFTPTGRGHPSPVRLTVEPPCASPPALGARTVSAALSCSRA